MSANLPSKVYLVYRTPPANEQGYRWGPLRRLYTTWAHVRLYMTTATNRRSTFKVYEADVTWREVEPT